jgi:hypothetical protein
MPLSCALNDDLDNDTTAIMSRTSEAVEISEIRPIELPHRVVNENLVVMTLNMLSERE